MFVKSLHGRFLGSGFFDDGSEIAHAMVRVMRPPMAMLTMVGATIALTMTIMRKRFC